MDVCTAAELPESYRVAVHEAGHAVAIERTRAGKVLAVEIDLNPATEDCNGRVQFRLRAAGPGEHLATGHTGQGVLRAHLIGIVAGPLAEARVRGVRNEGWSTLFELQRHYGYDLVDLVNLESSSRHASDYCEACRLCGLLRITLAEGLAMGEAFLDQPGVMAAVLRVADAVLEAGGQLDRDGFLASAWMRRLTPPGRGAALRARRKEAFRERLRLRLSQRRRPVPAWTRSLYRLWAALIPRRRP